MYQADTAALKVWFDIRKAAVPSKDSQHQGHLGTVPLPCGTPPCTGKHTVARSQGLGGPSTGKGVEKKIPMAFTVALGRLNRKRVLQSL